MDDYFEKTQANYQSLNPVSFLLKAAQIYPDTKSLVYNDIEFTWADTLRRCKLFASALHNIGLKKGDVVGFMAANTPELYEAHFSVPMAGMILNAINFRLDSKTISYIIDHAEIKLLVVDREFADVISQAVMKSKLKPILIDIDDTFADGGRLIGQLDYEKFLSLWGKK